MNSALVYSSDEELSDSEPSPSLCSSFHDDWQPFRVESTSETSAIESAALSNSKWSRQTRRELLRLRQRTRIAFGPCWKRGLDIAGALVGLAIFAPVMLLIAILVKATDGGPIFYYSARIGRHGRAYLMPKFRSMFVGAKLMWHQMKDRDNDLGESITFKMRRDPRVTWIGRIIRKTSLDELPQFWSVLKGDMSLVGPRPTLEEEFPVYTSYARQRLLMKPGITCTWQVEGRGDIPFDRQLEMDLDYYQQMNLANDIVLLLRTIPAVVSGKGAY